MAGNVKLLTSAGGGVILDTATTTATDVTVKVPVTGVNNGTLACTDANGNLGLGVTPSAWTNFKAFEIQYAGNGLHSTGQNDMNVMSNAYYNSGYKYAGTGSANILEMYNGAFLFKTAPSGTAGNPISFTQAMALDSSGNLLVGTTSSFSGTRFAVNGAFGNGVASEITNSSISSWTSVQFRTAGTLVGSITNSVNATGYNTSSDYRLKENIQPMQNALDVVVQLNPVTYTWKADGSDGQGFIAHELQAVVPDCVTGEKDAVDEEGKPVYQGIDTSFLVATLTKAIQEQQAQIEALTAKVAALEAK